MKRFSLLLTLFLFYGCNSATEGTPLAHHQRNPALNEFNADAIAWHTDNGEGLRMYMDDQYLYLQFDHSSISAEESKYIQFIIDSDNNVSTGNLTTENGADYIVENGYLYRAKRPDQWDWEEIGKVDSVVEPQRDTVRIEKSMLAPLSENFCVNAEVLNAKLEPILYSPDTKDANGNHLKTHYLKP